MRRSTWRVSLVALELLFAAWAWGQGSYKVENVALPAGSDLPKTLQDALQPQGERLADSKGTPVCEVWFGKSVAAQAGAASSGDVIYSGLSVGEFVGVLHFPNGSSDFRGQPIKAGFYTMRYALVPQDGNHMGVSPNRDFLLLGPIAADTDPGKTFGFNDLVKLSKQASGTNHPAVISLAAVNGQNFPSAAQDSQGHWMLQVKLPTSGGELPIAVILVGQAQS